MSNILKTKVTIVVVVLVVLSFLLILASSLFARLRAFGGSISEKVSYNVIGTAAASSTLSTFYASNTMTLDARYFKKLALDMRYSPATSTGSNRSLMVLVEVSNDDGNNFFPLVIPTEIATSSLIYTASSTVDGIFGTPVVLPAGQTLNVSSTYQASVLRNIIADKLRISVRENATNTFGYAYVRATLTND